MRILLTGFPGFIGRRVLAALAQRHPEARFVLLVQPALESVARARLDEVRLAGRAEVALGDLVQPGLGLRPESVAGVTHVWHLAAIYDLATHQEVAERVNVGGTVNVLDLCERLSGLQRLAYVSTCYVAGKRRGAILESELDEGQEFNNHYESTKMRAEVKVRERLERLPTTILRPAVVVGDSRTGETDKYDGPYYALRRLMASPPWLRLPMIGPGTAPFNIVPVDYVVAAAVAIAGRDDAVGVTCQLADPAPLTVREILEEASRALGRGGPLGRVPVGLVDGLLRVEAIRKRLRIPRETAVYMNHPVVFDTTNTERLLAGSAVRCPSLRDYLPTLITYMRNNPSKAFLDAREL